VKLFEPTKNNVGEHLPPTVRETQPAWEHGRGQDATDQRTPS
jgi:hypothetical protein